MSRKETRIRQHRQRMYADDPHCRYCRVALTPGQAKADHIVPRSRGGTNRRLNLALCCKACNARKADMLPAELLEWAQRIVSAASQNQAANDAA